MLFDGDNVIITGLTGMSGAGKTTACEVFAGAGYYIVNCDEVTRLVQGKGMPALKKIAAIFSGEVLLPDGSLDRKKLGGIVFSDAQKLKALENIVYPYICYAITEKIYTYSKKTSGTANILLDAPTLFESGMDIICDRIVSIVSDRELCLRRITCRDSLNAEQAEKRLASQHNADFYRSRSDICIENNGTREELKDKLLSIDI